ncbi:PTS glucitol/sorbitol transporter subunit IIA [Orbaceae bacterium ac157xtp]
MSNTIYQSKIIKIGDFAQDTLKEGMLITFKQGVPEDLADFCFVHTHDNLLADLAVGQTLKIGNNICTITAVGEVATTNFKELGHITIRFDSSDSAELPGNVHVSGSINNDINVDDVISIIAD